MSVLATRPNPTRQSSVPARKAAQAAHFHVNATGLRTALWRCVLDAELPHLADGSPRPLADGQDRPLSEDQLEWGDQDQIDTSM